MHRGLAAVSVAGEDQLLRDRRPRWRRRVGADRDGLGDALGDAMLARGGGDRDAVVVGGAELALEARLEARGFEVVEELLGLVLEAQDVDLGADVHVGEQRALLTSALDDRVSVRAG